MSKDKTHIPGRPSASLAEQEVVVCSGQKRSTRANAHGDVIGRELIDGGRKSLAAFKALLSPTKSAIKKRISASEGDITVDNNVNDFIDTIKIHSDPARAKSVPLQPSAPEEESAAPVSRSVRFASTNEYVDAKELLDDSITGADGQQIQLLKVDSIEIEEEVVNTEQRRKLALRKLAASELKRRQVREAARATARAVAAAIPGAREAKELRAAKLIQNWQRGRKQREIKEKENSDQAISIAVDQAIKQTLSAIQIQRIARAFVKRRQEKIEKNRIEFATVQSELERIAREQQQHIASVNLQRVARGFIARQLAKRERAALVPGQIQQPAAVVQTINDFEYNSMSDTEEEVIMAESSRPRYTGRCRDDFEEFMNKAEYWMINKKAVTDRQKIAQLSTMLSGGAEEWFNKQQKGYITTHAVVQPDGTVTTPAVWGPGLQGYDGVMAAMRAAFPKQERIAHSISAAFNCKQGKRAVEVYLEEIDREARKANLSDEVTIALAIAGLKPSIQIRVKDRADDTSTMADIRKWAVKAEDNQADPNLLNNDVAETLREFKADMQEEFSKLHINVLTATTTAVKSETSKDAKNTPAAVEQEWTGGRGGGYRSRGYGNRGGGGSYRGGGASRGAYDQDRSAANQAEYNSYAQNYPSLPSNQFPPPRNPKRSNLHPLFLVKNYLFLILNI